MEVTGFYFRYIFLVRVRSRKIDFIMMEEMKYGGFFCYLYGGWVGFEYRFVFLLLGYFVFSFRSNY